VRALLLAGGFGLRLRPITDTIPKCLVPIKGKPLLGYWFDTLLPNGVDRLLVNTHYMPEPVREYIYQSPWRESIDIVHEESLLGTGGTILNNRDFFLEKPFIVAHADNLTRFDARAFIEAHENRPDRVKITMMTFDTDSPQTCGIVEEDEHGLVVAFHEKQENPPGNHANGAVYIMDMSVIDFMKGLNMTVIDLSTEVLPHFMGRIHTFHNSDYHRDIGSMESLAIAEKEF